MFSDVHKQVITKINKSKIEEYPYPYITVDNIFPKDFYKSLIEKQIPLNELTNLKESGRVGAGYSDARHVLNLESHMPSLSNNREFWENFAKWLHYYFADILLQKFKQTKTNIKVDALYTKDYQTYSLGPHTDKINKVLTCLIYLPQDSSNTECGTSIYLPKDLKFICSGGPHHKREDFILHKTIPYEPNKLFCFLKTNNSFHGVEPITKQIERTLLIFDLQRQQ